MAKFDSQMSWLNMWIQAENGLRYSPPQMVVLQVSGEAKSPDG